jgi:very-short-patch-repair endonuclease
MNAMLISKGFQIIRFTNDEMENPLSVREKLMSLLESLPQNVMRKEENFPSFRR